MTLLCRSVLHFACVIALNTLAVAPAHAQTTPQQKVTGPQARYWVSAETGSGLMAAGSGGFGAVMGSLLGRGGPTKTLLLELAGLREGNPSEGLHALPAGVGLGPNVSLLGPLPTGGETPERRERDIPSMPDDKPKGRMLLFWGCGETAGPGQPVVLDFAKIADGILPADMRSTHINPGRTTPYFARDRAHAVWPNYKHRASVPGQASLVGEHTVTGNFVPEIRFTVGQEHDFMEPVALNRGTTPSGSLRLSWTRPATALAFHASGMGFKDAGGGVVDMVFWNSSTARLIGGDQLNGFLAPAEAERLVKAQVLLSSQTGECLVPKDVLAAAGGDLMMANLNAFGPELNVVHPPRPSDPKVTWEQVYQVKVRQRAHTSSLGGISAMAGGLSGDSARPTAEKPAEDKPLSPADAVKGLLKGIWGR